MHYDIVYTKKKKVLDLYALTTIWSFFVISDNILVAL